MEIGIERCFSSKRKGYRPNGCGSTRTSKQLESVKHLLWHGNTEEALERIGGLNIEIDLLRAFSPPADKLGKSLGEFETYIRNNMGFFAYPRKKV